jgi:hypothetical protein
MSISFRVMKMLDNLGMAALPQVLNAVPETIFSALRNSALARVWDSSARSFSTLSFWREKAAITWTEMLPT